MLRTMPKPTYQRGSSPRLRQEVRFLRALLLLESPVFCRGVAHAAKLVPSDLDRSMRSRMNFTRIEDLAAAARNAGRVFRRAIAARCSEGARPDRTVRIQEPNDRQTDLGVVAARICSSPWAISPSWMWR